MKSQLFFTILIKWTFCYYWPSFFQVVGNLKSSNRKLAFSWLQMSGLQTFQKFDKTALRCLLQYCVFNACILELSWSDTYFKMFYFFFKYWLVKIKRVCPTKATFSQEISLNWSSVGAGEAHFYHLSLIFILSFHFYFSIFNFFSSSFI